MAAHLFDPAFVAELARRGTCVVPTLTRDLSAFAYTRSLESAWIAGNRVPPRATPR